MALKSNNHSIGIIVPMYNEEKGASECIEAVIKVIKELQPVKKLIVVDDGSKDKTLLTLKEKQKIYKQKLLIVESKKNGGYGKALQKGIEKAAELNLEYVLFMDSDLTNDPKYIIDFVNELPNGYDCVKASRYIQGGKMEGVPLKRMIYSYAGSYVSRKLFRLGIRDCTNGFRMVKLARLKDIHFIEKDFSIILEELYYLKKMKATFKEIPNILTNRKEGKTHFSYTPKLLSHYLKYAIKALLL